MLFIWARVYVCLRGNIGIRDVKSSVWAAVGGRSCVIFVFTSSV